MMSSFVSDYVPFEISKFFISGRNLAEIWLRGQILGAAFESEVILYIRGQYQANIGHFLQFCLRKSEKHSLTAMATIKVTDKQNLNFAPMLHLIF